MKVVFLFYLLVVSLPILFADPLAVVENCRNVHSAQQCEKLLREYKTCVSFESSVECQSEKRFKDLFPKK